VIAPAPSEDAPSEDAPAESEGAPAPAVEELEPESAALPKSKTASLWKKAAATTIAANRVSAFGVTLRTAPSPQEAPPKQAPPKPAAPAAALRPPPPPVPEGPERNFNVPPELEGVFSEKDVNSFRELFLL
jgi:hypothetical protein